MTAAGLPKPIITLLTDFGLRDAYVAAMKGVILGINPKAVLVDITHEIPPREITAGAFVLSETAPYFPPATIHLAVVDPGVGTGRRGLAAKARHQFFVGPDNGLFHFIFQDASDLTVVSLENTAYFRPEISTTFHGRDIFAPVAAYISLGVPLTDLGPPVMDPVLLPIPEAVFTDVEAQGEVIYADRFGNLVSNIPWAALLDWLNGRNIRLHIGSHTLTRLSRTYADAPPGELLALMGSHGRLEIAVNQGSAARRLGLMIGAPLTIQVSKLI